MRAWMVTCAVVWLGCSVKLSGAPCADDLQCPAEQRCSPEGQCVDGPRTAQMVGESCREALGELAERTAGCFGGPAEAYLGFVGPEGVCASVEASVRDGRQAFVPEQFGQCLRNLRETPCGEVSLEAFALGNLLERCPAFVSRVEPGSACGNSADCLEGWCQTSGQCPGRCQRFIPYGEACTAKDRCQPGSSCAAGTCRRFAGLGGACSLGVECDPGANAVCLDGRCVERKQSGECRDFRDCQAGYVCAKVQVDSGTSLQGECRPAKPLGMSCAPGVGECAPTLYCDGASARCVSWPGAGAACGDVGRNGEFALCLGSRCSFGAFFQLICQPHLAPGEACGSDLDCGPSNACQPVCDAAGSCSGKSCMPIWCP